MIYSYEDDPALQNYIEKIKKDDSEGSWYTRCRPDLIFIENGTDNIYLIETKTCGYTPGYNAFCIKANEFIFQYKYYMNNPFPIIFINRSEYWSEYKLWPKGGPWFVFKMEDALKSIMDIRHIRKQCNPWENIHRFEKFRDDIHRPDIHIDDNAPVTRDGSDNDYMRIYANVKQDEKWCRRLNLPQH